MNDNLEAEQIALEEEAAGLGITRYRDQAARDQTWTPAGRSLLSTAVEQMMPALDQRIQSLLHGRANQMAWVARFFQQLEDPVEVSTLVTATACIREIYASQNPVQTVAIQIAECLESTVNYEAFAIAHPKLYQSLRKRTARASNAASRQIILRAWQRRASMAPIEWSEPDLLRVGLNLIDLFCKSTSLARITTTWVRPKNGRPMKKAIIAPEECVMQRLHEEHSKAELLRPRLFPMIVPPRDWTTPVNGGYVTQALRREAVKRIRHSELQDLHEPTLDTVYAALNILQRTAWAVNKDVFDVLTQAWSNGMELAGLPKREQVPLPPRVQDPEANPEAYKARQAAARKIHYENEVLRNARYDVEGKST